MKQLLVDPEPVLSRDRNQLTEFMVRGRYPIAIGLNALALQDFQRHGVGKSLKTQLQPELDYQASGSTVWLLNKAPHPMPPRSSSTGCSRRMRRRRWARELQTGRGTTQES